MLAVMDGNGESHLWEIASRKERAVFRGGERISEPKYDVPFAFSPDGQMFAVRCRDGTIKVWDLARVDRKPPDATETARLWTLLADEDAAVAYRAIRTLTAFPTHLLPLLRKQFHPSQNSEEQTRKIDRLLANLDSEDFGIRQKAYKELEHFGWRAEEALQRMLAGRPSLEVRRRVSVLLENIEHRGAVESIQQLRALEVLEHIGTAEARSLLRDIAKGVPEVRLRQEAKASLARLAKRPTPKP
ncbi:MAG TPA: hypothetical protein VH682_17350 [Gemmataceae bacterium]|jgi:hypothetical protein